MNDLGEIVTDKHDAGHDAGADSGRDGAADKVTKSLDALSRGLKLLEEALAMRTDLIRLHEIQIANVGISASPRQLAERMAEADAAVAEADRTVRTIQDGLWKAMAVCIEATFRVNADSAPWRTAAAADQT